MRARKKPVEVEVREPNRKFEVISTLEGVLVARRGEHFIIKGIEGEEYPIRKDIFYKTYDVIEE